MEIYVSRHTKVDVLDNICYGQSDVPLLNSFETEVLALQKKIPLTFDRVISSPLSRCRLLAEQFSEAPLLEKDLLEMNFGDWELQSWNSIDPTALQIWMNDFVNNKTPNGENMLELYQRVTQFMDHLRTERYQRVLLVAHAGVIRCLWAYLLGIPLQNAFKIAVKYGQPICFTLGENAAYDLMKGNL